MKRILFFIAAIFLLASCRTVTKTQDSHVVKTETVKEEKKDSSGVKEETTITEIKTDEETNTVVEGEFEVDTTTGSGIKAEDYDPGQPAEIVDEVPMITVDKEGNVTIKGPIKKFKVTGETKKTVTDSTARHTKDTASVSTSGKTTINTTDEEKHSITHRQGIVETIFRRAFWPVFLAAIAYFVFIYLKRKKAKAGKKTPG